MWAKPYGVQSPPVTTPLVALQRVLLLYLEGQGDAAVTARYKRDLLLTEGRDGFMRGAVKPAILTGTRGTEPSLRRIYAYAIGYHKESDHS